MIDDIVIASKGAYTHDEVFMLPAGFAYSLKLYQYEVGAYHARAEQIKDNLNGNSN